MEEPNDQILREYLLDVWVNFTTKGYVYIQIKLTWRYQSGVTDDILTLTVDLCNHGPLVFYLDNRYILDQVKFKFKEWHFLPPETSFKNWVGKHFILCMKTVKILTSNHSVTVIVKTEPKFKLTVSGHFPAIRLLVERWETAGLQSKTPANHSTITLTCLGSLVSGNGEVRLRFAKVYQKNE